MSAEVVLVKLGGSLITDKRRPDTPRQEVIERLAREVSVATEDGSTRLLLGHGSGSFGHVAASRYGFVGGALSAEQLAGVPVVQERAADLHRRVCRALQVAGSRPFSLAPSSFLTTREGRPQAIGTEPLFMALERDLLPVIYGDVVVDEAWGAAICSTETLFRALVEPARERGFTVGRALWLGETEGLYDREGQTIPEIQPGESAELLEEVGEAAGADVTGGMRHRLETACALARLGVESLILNGLTDGILGRALAGEPVPGTRVLPAS
jgi:isopentenyl phosphate kinase